MAGFCVNLQNVLKERREAGVGGVYGTFCVCVCVFDGWGGGGGLGGGG